MFRDDAERSYHARNPLAVWLFFFPFEAKQLYALYLDAREAQDALKACSGGVGEPIETHEPEEMKLARATVRTEREILSPTGLVT